jgi:hypothetical protein
MTSHIVLNQQFIFCTFLRITSEPDETELSIKRPIGLFFHALSDEAIKLLVNFLLLIPFNGSLIYFKRPDMEETSTIPEWESKTDLWLCKKNNKQHQKYSNGANNLSHYRSCTSCIYFAGLGPSNCGQHRNIDRIQRCATKYILEQPYRCSVTYKERLLQADLIPLT